jgi:hypothetical protein
MTHKKLKDIGEYRPHGVSEWTPSEAYPLQNEGQSEAYPSSSTEAKVKALLTSDFA